MHDTSANIPGVIIAGLQKSSFIDYPGTVSTVLFLSGCNLRCPYCHNPGVVLGRYEPIPYGDVYDHFIKRKGIIDSAVISGGEPTLHKGLKDLCGGLRSLDLKIKIDTNGLEPKIISDCRPDYLAVDVKTSLQKYPRLSNPYDDHAKRLCQSIDIAKSMAGSAEVRITAVPGIIDAGDIDNLCAELRGVNKIFIQRFDPTSQLLDPSYSLIKNYAAQELETWREKFLNAGINCSIR